MIDYIKLKQAYEMAAQCKSHYLVHIVSNKGNELSLVDWKPDMSDFVYKDIDDLTAKLQELTQPKSKYKIGQKVWRLNSEYEPYCLTIRDIDLGSDEMYLDEDDDWWIEEQLYPSKEALIEAQITYWNIMLHKPDNCQHEAEESEHVFHMDIGQFTMKRCVKCGEFYK